MVVKFPGGRLGHGIGSQEARLIRQMLFINRYSHILYIVIRAGKIYAMKQRFQIYKGSFTQWIILDEMWGVDQHFEHLCSVAVDKGILLTLNVQGPSHIGLFGQYHGCWCPGSSRHQDINNNAIDCVEYVGLGLTWGRILSTCVISMWSNDIKCKYMFIFPLKKTDKI